VPIFNLDLGADSVASDGNYLAGDYEGTLADSVIVDAVVEGVCIEPNKVLLVFWNRRLGII
jgi:hypothetical protein